MQISTVSVSDLSSACAEVWNVLHLFVLRDFTLLLSFSCFLFWIWDLGFKPSSSPFPISNLGFGITLNFSLLGKTPISFSCSQFGILPFLLNCLGFCLSYASTQPFSEKTFAMCTCTSLLEILIEFHARV